MPITTSASEPFKMPAAEFAFGYPASKSFELPPNHIESHFERGLFANMMPVAP